MQYVTTKKLTDKAAIEYTNEVQDDVVYIHKSGTIRRAYLDDQSSRVVTYEEAKNHSAGLGFEPSPNSSYIG